MEAPAPTALSRRSGDAQRAPSLLGLRGPTVPGSGSKGPVAPRPWHRPVFPKGPQRPSCGRGGRGGRAEGLCPPPTGRPSPPTRLHPRTGHQQPEPWGPVRWARPRQDLLTAAGPRVLGSPLLLPHRPLGGRGQQPGQRGSQTRAPQGGGASRGLCPVPPEHRPCSPGLWTQAVHHGPLSSVPRRGG